MTQQAPERGRSFRPSRRTLLRAGIPAAVALAGGTAIYGATVASAAGPSDTELATELTTRVKAYLATTGSQTQASVAVSRGSRYITTNKSRVHDTASIVKMEILAMLLEKYSSVSAIPSDKKDLAKKMITVSDNDATTKLYNFLGGCDALAAAHKRYGLTYTKSSADCRWGLTTTNVTDQLNIVNRLLYKGMLADDEVNYARSLMGSVSSNQDWGVKAAAKSGETVWIKNGWDSRSSLGGLWVVNSVGVINVPNQKAIRMAILTSKAANESNGIKYVEEIAKIARSVINKAVL
jgi:beta-lactamase class A